MAQSFYYKLKRLPESFGFAALLNLLLPGSGHMLWHDYLFGVFVLLIALLAAALFFFSVLFPLPVTVKIVLFGLPAIFYVFTFVDLRRAVRKKRPGMKLSPRVAVVFLAVVMVIQLLAPVTPGNFALRNAPRLFTVKGNNFAPLFRDGDVALAEHFDYYAGIFFLNHPVWYEAPQAGDIVRFADRDGRDRLGLVLGAFGAQVEVIDGELYVNGEYLPDAFDPRLRVTGDMPLTVADPGSILVATLTLGAIDQVRHVPGDRPFGKVHRLF